MRKLFVAIVISILLFPTLSYSQIQDVDLVDALIGSNVFELHETLETLELWNHGNPSPTDNAKYSVSIENGTGTTKLFTFFYDGNGWINKMVINYQHDNRKHLEELDKLKKIFDNVHVGKFSTDVTVTYRKWKKLNR